MRIEAYTQIQQLYNTSKAGKTQKTTKKSFMDAVQISSTGKDYQTAKAAVFAAPDIREDVTAPIREAVQSGSYDVSSDDFAERLLEKYSTLLG